ncbi:MAG: recombinase family protein [Thalassobaculum sp.]
MVIAQGLNADGIPSPTGSIWRKSVINGNRARGSGILWNMAYRGVLVHNRIRMVKDPETGKRISRPNPVEEWITVDVPALRIIDEATWQAAQAVKEQYSGLAGISRRPRPKHLLSGLLRCGCCGASMTVYSGEKTRCATRREGGICSNDRTVLLSVAGERIMGGLRRNLLSARVLAKFIKTYEAERRTLRSQRAATHQRSTTRLREIQATMDNLVDAIGAGIASDTMKRRLVDLEQEAAILRRQIAEPDDNRVVSLHPAAVDEYRREIDTLLDLLASDDVAQAGASAMLRNIIDRIDVMPLEGRGQYELRVMTKIETLIELATGTHGVGCGTVVAEEGLEPPTRGL